MLRHRWSHYSSFFCLSLLSLSFVSCSTTDPPPPNKTAPEKQQVFLFLLDSTSSLNEAESKQVAALAADMLNVLPPNSRYGMYPIEKEGSRVLPLYPDGTVPVPINNVQEAEYKEQAPQRSKTIADNLQTEYKTGNHTADDMRSCVMNMLWFAEKQLKKLANRSTLNATDEYRLIIISDMVEECAGTPLGEIRLNKRDIKEEIQKADNYSQLTSPPDLSNVRVTVIFPLTRKSPADSSRRPEDRDLRDFWSKIFAHCNVKDIDWIATGQFPNWYNEELKRIKAKMSQ